MAYLSYLGKGQENQLAWALDPPLQLSSAGLTCLCNYALSLGCSFLKKQHLYFIFGTGVAPRAYLAHVKCVLLHWDISLIQNRDFKYLRQDLRLTVMNVSSLNLHLY